MHIDVPVAGLIAQVYPVLVLALVIEGRLRARPDSPYRIRHVVHHFLRTGAAIGGLVSTGFGVLVVANGGAIEGWLGGVVDWVSTISLVLLIFGLLLVFMRMFDGESSLLWVEIRKGHSGDKS